MVAGKVIKFTVITNDDKGCCYQGSNQVSVQLDIKATTQVKDNRDGTYVASFTPQQTGKLKVSVLVNGEHVKGSPYSISVRRYTSLSKPSKVINENGNIGEPWGIGFSRSGNWAVADSFNHCVYLYDSEDQLVKKIGSEGSNDGQFYTPEGVAFDNDHLYVTDCGNDRVQKFTSNGDYLLQFKRQGIGNGQLSRPKGLTIHSKKVYVADSNNKAISVFLTDGTFHQTIGRQQLGDPHDVTISNTNELFVADYYQHCVHRFTLDGSYMGKFSSRGTDKGQLDSPYGISIDPYDFIFVADLGNFRVTIFDHHGQYVHCFGSKGTGLGEFNKPYGVALNWKGDLYVTDHYNRRIQIFTDW